MSFGFIIPTCCRNKIHLNQLHRCINSIRRFYLNNNIILINDSIDYFDLSKEFINDKFIHIIKSYNNGSADQQIFKVFLETELFDKVVFLQDSMILNKKLENIEKVSFKFIWHFTNHRNQWDQLKEPICLYNTKNNIISHTDLIRHIVLRDYNDNKNFQKFCIENLNKKNKWVGSFGSLCILNKKTLKQLNSEVNFIEKFLKYTSNRDRRANESIFSLISHYVFPENNFQESYDELYYDGINHGGNKDLIGTNTGFDSLKWCAVHKYFSKVSFNR